MSGATPPAAPRLWLLIALAAIGPFAMNLPIPAMPAMSRDFEVPYGAVQLVLTLYLASIAASQLVLGPLSDRVGRRPAMIAGLCLFWVGAVICALAPSVPLLLAGRIVQAFGGSAGLVLGRAIVRDLYGRERSASLIGYITMAMVVAPMVAPLAGGLIVESAGWRPLFWILALAGLLLTPVTVALLGETHGAAGRASGPGPLKGSLILLRLRAFVGHALTLAFASGMFFGFLGGAPYIVVELMHRTPSEYGAWFVASGFCYMFGNFLSGRYAERLGPLTLMRGGTLFGLAGLALLWLLAGIAHPAAIFMPMCLIAVSNGLVLPSATASAVSVRPEMAGSASGLAGSLQLGTGAAMSFLVGLLVQQSTWPMILVMTACGLVSLFGLVLNREDRV